MRTAVTTFVRMNPPTIGHEHLVDKLKAVAKQYNGVPLVFLSHSTSPDKDPLPYETKIKFARQAFGSCVQTSKVNTLFAMLKDLDGKYDNVYIVVGSDRFADAARIAKDYNGKEFNFKMIKAISAGERDPDDDGVQGMSASKMREAVRSRDFSKFLAGTPKGVNSKQLYDTVSKQMNINEQIIIEGEDDEPDDKELEDFFNKYHDLIAAEEPEDDDEDGEEELEERVVTFAQRLKMARNMKIRAPKMARMRKVKMKRMAPMERLQQRSRKMATMFLRKRVAGKKGMDYSNLSTGQKIAIDKQIEGRRKSIGRISQRLMPMIRKKELARMQSARTGVASSPGPATVHKEETNINELSQDTKNRYIRRASDSQGHAAFAKRQTTDPDEKKEYERIEKNRRKGLNRAFGEEKNMGSMSQKDDNEETGVENIIIQLRKSVNLRGMKDVMFDSGEKIKVPSQQATRALATFNNIKSSQQKGEYMKKLQKSHSSFTAALKEEVIADLQRGLTINEAFDRFFQ